jgi:hypothetical protein
MSAKHTRDKKDAIHAVAIIEDVLTLAVVVNRPGAAVGEVQVGDDGIGHEPANNVSFFNFLVFLRHHWNMGDSGSKSVTETRFVPGPTTTANVV